MSFIFYVLLFSFVYFVIMASLKYYLRRDNILFFIGDLWHHHKVLTSGKFYSVDNNPYSIFFQKALVSNNTINHVHFRLIEDRDTLNNLASQGVPISISTKGFLSVTVSILGDFPQIETNSFLYYHKVAREYSKTKLYGIQYKNELQKKIVLWWMGRVSKLLSLRYQKYTKYQPEEDAYRA